MAESWKSSLRHWGAAAFWYPGSTGSPPTFVNTHYDRPGHVALVTAALAKQGINIATMQLYRRSKGGQAVMVIECDDHIPPELVEKLTRMEGILKVTYLDQEKK